MGIKKMTDEAIKKCFKGTKYFKYRGIKFCLINYNLGPQEKQRALHELIKEKHTVKL